MIEPEQEEAAVLAAVPVLPDERHVFALPASHGEIQKCAQDAVRGLFAIGCEYFRVTVEPTRKQLVVDGWRQTPERAAAYTPPELVRHESGFSMELRRQDRQALRNIVRRTHREYFRETPSNAQCDQLIDSMGPKVAHALLKAAIDTASI